MEPNIPVVGGEEPVPESPSSAPSPAEATNGVTHDVEMATSAAPPQETIPEESAAAVTSSPVEAPASDIPPVEAPASDATEAAVPASAPVDDQATVGDAPVSDMQTLLDQQQDESQVKKGDILEGT